MTTTSVTAADGWLEVVETWLATFDEHAPGIVEGLYVVGSAALNDWQPHSSDVDVVAVTAEPADEETSGALLAAHAVFAERHPERAVDGPFVAWGDLVVPAQNISRPWTLDGLFHHDAECFEINPVTWFTLAKYGVCVRGPELSEIPVAIDVDERVRFVVDNATTYWRTVHGELVGALGELGAEATLPSTVAEWCLLGVCRMLYTATTGDVTSNSGAGRWAAGVLGEDHRTICAAVVEMRSAPAIEIGRPVLQATEAAMAEVLRRIRTLPA